MIKREWFQQGYILRSRDRWKEDHVCGRTTSYRDYTHSADTRKGTHEITELRITKCAMIKLHSANCSEITLQGAQWVPISKSFGSICKKSWQPLPEYKEPRWKTLLWQGPALPNVMFLL
ncbi:Os12g0572750 [Oryza sativa Japonica Group]|uniref:Os12g0572750 protein n=1 Tax=Oryza sativa subsp. japonica TaxID=39947 RepID=A0A0P0YBN4_ORYSJ|nr:hypothetical protein EE612_060424 [Oryza sativa]BAT17756.1 Os12g0572750 [Oryza sativa Japonica Group]